MNNQFSFADGLRYDFFNHFEEIKNEWKELLPPGHHLASNDMLALELSKPEDIEFKYLNLYENEEWIGVVYLQEFVFSQKHYNKKVFQQKYVKLFKCLIERQKINLMICGNLFRVNFQGFYFKEKSNKEKVFKFLSAYRDNNKKTKNFCGMLVKDCSREFDTRFIDSCQYKPFRQDLTMELEIWEQWNSYQDYINSLSRKYRQRANKINKTSSILSLKELDANEIQEHKSKINELYLSIVNKQNIALGILNENYFIEMKKLLKEDFKVFAYLHKDDLVGFSSHIYYPNKRKMEIHYIGFDEVSNHEYSIYFQLLFDGLKAAIDGKFLKIELGRTAREAKASLGAKACENFNYIWVKPGLARLTFNFISNWFEQTMGENWQSRSPFKELEN